MNSQPSPSQDKDFSTALSEAQALMRQSDFKQALAAYDAMVTSSEVKQLPALLGKARAEIELGLLNQASQTLEQSCQGFPGAAEVWLVRSRCEQALGNQSAERAMLEKALSLSPLHLEATRRLLNLLEARGELEQAHVVISEFVAAGGDKNELLMQEAKLYETGKDFEQALSLWERLMQLRGHEHSAAFAGTCRCLVNLSKFADLRALYDSCDLKGPQRTNLLRMLVRYPDSKLEPFFSTLSFEENYLANTSIPHAFNLYADRLRLFASKDAVLKAERKHAVSQRMTASLAEAISSVEVSNAELRVNEKLHSFWRLCGSPFDEFETWMRKAVWNQKATNLVDTSLSLAYGDPSRLLTEVVSISAPADFSLLEDALAKGRGCLVAGSHLGPTRVTVILLDSYLQNFRVVGGYPRARANGSDRDIFLRHGTLPGVKQIASSLNLNEVVACAPDSVHEDDPKYFYHSEFGRTPLQPTYASIQYRTNASAIWSGSYWKDGIVHTQFQRLPSPKPGEDKDHFVNRWCECYLSYQVDFLKNNLPLLKYAYVIGREWTY